ncbi:MAG TPA: PKD domain-containing protein [Candidatus Poseidoniales archaeon]|nr:PKD domain-containing protein [Candidatus Poseidoniales archaeon]
MSGSRGGHISLCVVLLLASACAGCTNGGDDENNIDLVLRMEGTNTTTVVEYAGDTVITDPADQAGELWFDLSGSSSEDASIVTFIFDFGDGTSEIEGTNGNVTHAFATQGIFTTTYTVKDEKSRIKSVQVRIRVDHRASRTDTGVVGDPGVFAIMVGNESTSVAPASFNLESEVNNVQTGGIDQIPTPGQAIDVIWTLYDDDGGQREQRQATIQDGESMIIEMSLCPCDHPLGEWKLEISVDPDEEVTVESTANVNYPSIDGKLSEN